MMLLKRWKIKNDNLCNVCKDIEDYEHYFIKCKYFKDFTEKIKILLASVGIKKDIFTLKSIIIGYKIENKEYNAINYIIICAAFSIYKTYHISDLKTKYTNVYWIFKDTIKTVITLYKHKNQTIPKIFKSIITLLET